MSDSLAYSRRGASRGHTAKGHFLRVSEPRLAGSYLVIPKAIADKMGITPETTERVALMVDESTREIVIAKRIMGVFLTEVEMARAARLPMTEENMGAVEALESVLMNRVMWYASGGFRVFVRTSIRKVGLSEIADILDGVDLKFRLYRYNHDTQEYDMLRVKLSEQNGQIDDRVHDGSGEATIEAIPCLPSE